MTNASQTAMATTITPKIDLEGDRDHDNDEIFPISSVFGARTTRRSLEAQKSHNDPPGPANRSSPSLPPSTLNGSYNDDGIEDRDDGPGGSTKSAPNTTTIDNSKGNISSIHDGSIRIASGSGYRYVTPFPWRLHELLCDDPAPGAISWLDDGRCFRVHQPQRFIEEVSPAYFSHKSYKSFQRQLHLYGFERITSGQFKGAYFHPNFIESDRSLTHQIPRIKAPTAKTRRTTKKGTKSKTKPTRRSARQQQARKQYAEELTRVTSADGPISPNDTPSSFVSVARNGIASSPSSSASRIEAAPIVSSSSSSISVPVNAISSPSSSASRIHAAPIVSSSSSSISVPVNATSSPSSSASRIDAAPIVSSSSSSISVPVNATSPPSSSASRIEAPIVSSSSSSISVPVNAASSPSSTSRIDAAPIVSSSSSISVQPSAVPVNATSAAISVCTEKPSQVVSSADGGVETMDTTPSDVNGGPTLSDSFTPHEMDLFPFWGDGINDILGEGFDEQIVDGVDDPLCEHAEEIMELLGTASIDGIPLDDEDDVVMNPVNQVPSEIDIVNDTETKSKNSSSVSSLVDGNASPVLDVGYV